MAAKKADTHEENIITLAKIVGVIVQQSPRIALHTVVFCNPIKEVYDFTGKRQTHEHTPCFVTHTNNLLRLSPRDNSE